MAGWVGVLCSDCGKGGGRWKGSMMILVNPQTGVSSEWLDVRTLGLGFPPGWHEDKSFISRAEGGVGGQWGGHCYHHSSGFKKGNREYIKLAIRNLSSSYDSIK